MIARLFTIAVALALASCNKGSSPFGSTPTPTFNYVKESEGGCGDLYLHKGTADSREVLWISAQKGKLTFPGTFDLASAPDGLSIGIDLWDKAPKHSAYCNDISSDTKKTAIWKAKKGKVTITVSPPIEREGGGPKQYKATARLEGVVFEDDAGHSATLKEETITDALVGWYAG